MLKRNEPPSSFLNNYSKLNTKHNWENLCIQFKNQQTRTSDNHNYLREGSISNPVVVHVSL